MHYGILTILKIGVLAGIVAFNNANAYGVNWQRANIIQQYNQTISSVTYGGGQFVATASHPGGGFLTSPDGMTWTWRQVSDAQLFRDITWGGNQFVAVGSSLTSAQIMISPDGVTWTQRNLPTQYVPRRRIHHRRWVLWSEWSPVSEASSDAKAMAIPAQKPYEKVSCNSMPSASPPPNKLSSLLEDFNLIRRRF